MARAGSLVLATDMIELLWPGNAPASAATIVHRHVGGLRRVLEPGLPVRASGRFIRRRTWGYQLRVVEGTLDLPTLRRAAGWARTALAAQDVSQAVHWAALGRVAVDAAIQTCNSDGQARTQRSLAGAYSFLREFGQAASHFERAYEPWRPPAPPARRSG